MNHMLPISPVLLLTLLAAEVLPNRSSQVIEREEVVAGRPGAPAESVSPAGHRCRLSGQELVSQAAQRLLLLPGIEAKTRQQVNIFGQQLVGSGIYLQLTNGPRLMLRLDMKLQVAARSRRACNRSVMATRSGSAAPRGHETTLSASICGDCATAASKIGPPMFRLPHAVDGAWEDYPNCCPALDSAFRLRCPAGSPMVGQLPVWSLEGRWKPAVLGQSAARAACKRYWRVSRPTCRNCHRTCRTA